MIDLINKKQVFKLPLFGNLKLSISWHLLICRLAGSAVIACNSHIASPVQWDKAGGLAVSRPLSEATHNWTREQRTKHSNWFDWIWGLSNGTKLSPNFFFTPCSSIQATFQSLLGNSYNHLILSIGRLSLAWPDLCGYTCYTADLLQTQIIHNVTGLRNSSEDKDNVVYFTSGLEVTRSVPRLSVKEDVSYATPVIRLLLDR